MKRMTTLLILSGTISASLFAASSPLATQAWTRHEFYRAIQETGRTNVLTAADRQMISNYVDEVCHLYAERAGTLGAGEVAFDGGNAIFRVGDVVVTNAVRLGWRASTNAGMRVSSSSIPETPAGTRFAWNPAETNYVNLSATPVALAASWHYSEATNIQWKALASGTRAVTNIATRCFMRLSHATNGCEWTSQQIGETWIVHKHNATGDWVGSFTLVPDKLTDAQRDACLLPELSLLLGDAPRRFSILDLFFPTAHAVPYGEPPSSADSGEFFLSVEIDGLYYEVVLPDVAPARGVGVVDDGGSYYSGDRIFVPCPWESLADWCNPANRWGESVSISIPFKTPAGTIDYIQKELSVRRLANNFPELESRLARSYIFPVEVKQYEPCDKEMGGHTWGTDEYGCVCTVCSARRDCDFGHLGNDTTKCQTCLNFLGKEYETTSPHDPVEHDESDPRCGVVSLDVERHVGWHQGSRVTTDSSSVAYWLYNCTCQCGFFGRDAVNQHDFNDDDLGEWEPGEDESGANADLYHHADIPCARVSNGVACDGVMPKKELHDVLRPDGSVAAGGGVYPIKNEGGAIVRCAADDPLADTTYHGQTGTCYKCSASIQSLATHAPDPNNDCLCPCGMTVHSIPDEADECGNYRCRNCTAFIRSEYGEDESHWGYVSRDGDDVYHWCYCGRTHEPHEEYIKIRSDGTKYCEACGHEFGLSEDGDNHVERYRARYYPNIKNGQAQSAGVSAWSNAGGGGGSGGSGGDGGGDLRGTLPDGVTEADVKDDDVDAKLAAKGWRRVRFKYYTRRHWFNLWVATPVWETVYQLTNHQGKTVEFVFVKDLGLTFWEN